MSGYSIRSTDPVARSARPYMPDALRAKVEAMEAGDPAYRIEEREGGAVYFVEKMRSRGPDGSLHEVIAESRIDSREDPSSRAKGIPVWFDKYLSKPPKR